MAANKSENKIQSARWKLPSFYNLMSYVTCYHCYSVPFIVNVSQDPAPAQKRWRSLGATVEGAFTDMIPNLNVMESCLCCSYMICSETNSLSVVMWIDALQIQKREIIGPRKM